MIWQVVFFIFAIHFTKGTFFNNYLLIHLLSTTVWWRYHQMNQIINLIHLDLFWTNLNQLEPIWTNLNQLYMIWIFKSGQQILFTLYKGGFWTTSMNSATKMTFFAHEGIQKKNLYAAKNFTHIPFWLGKRLLNFSYISLIFLVVPNLLWQFC